MGLGFQHICLIADRERHVYYEHQAIKDEAPRLYQRLLDHKDKCTIKNHNKPFRAFRHIVYCPQCETRLASLKEERPEWIISLSPRSVETIGIIGFGSFGQFLSRSLALQFDVTASDKLDHSLTAGCMGVRWDTIGHVANNDVVILAVPLTALEDVLETISSHLRPQSLVMDVCSVKQEPIRLMRSYLHDVQILGTHPLFGPQSAKEGTWKHKIVVWPVTASSKETDQMLAFFRDSGLDVIEMPPDEHDRQMANVQALTHFIARALADMNVNKSPLATSAFDHLIKVNELLGRDSWDLFLTIQTGNPFAEEVRRTLLTKLTSLENSLTHA